MSYSYFQLQGQRNPRPLPRVRRVFDAETAPEMQKRGRTVGGELRLGGDEHRLVLAERLGKAVREVKSESPAGEVLSMGPRTTWLEVPRLNLAVGDAIRLADSIKIFEQYCKVLSKACKEPGTFLGGASDSCVGNLGWMKGLVTPMHVGEDDASVVFSCKTDTKQEITRGPTAFSCKTDTKQDITRAAIAEKYPLSQEYEVLVAQSIARLYPESTASEFHALFEGWRECGMLYPVLLCARMMPKLKDWFAEEQHGHARDWGKFLKALNSKRDFQSVSQVLGEMERAVKWDSPIGLAVSSTLDRACVLMRVKSNEAVGLDAALKRFPDLEVLPAHRSWLKVRKGLEGSFPPSLFLASSKRASWGLSKLTPGWDGARLLFKEAQLEWRATPSVSSELEIQKSDTINTGGARLQDVISRMGEIALSPEMGQMMVYALDARVSMENGKNTLSENEREVCHNPALLMDFMGDPGSTSDPADIQEFVTSLWTRLPLVKSKACDASLLAWRIDTPSRIVLSTGRVKHGFEPEFFKPTELDKVLIDERSSLKPVGLIRLATPGPGEDHPQLVRSSLVHFANKHLEEAPKETVRRDGGNVHTNTCLHEALACFTLREPDLHTKVEVHSSLKWDNEYEDGRYAETQTASNGTRYRDWVSMLSNERGNQKSRLDSHVVKYDRLFETMFPWQRAEGQLEWVSVASTVQPDLRVLHDRSVAVAGDDQEKSRFRTFVSSVKARFLQDLKLLPVRHESHRVERANTSVYMDEGAGQVLICYAPTGDDQKRVEFLALGLGGVGI